jgi:hypothetical protein
MAATDLWQVNGNGHAPPHGPSDREVVEALQRIASARAHLTHAEAQARAMDDPQVSAATDRRNRDIENAHAELLWAQAALLSPAPGLRAEKLVGEASTAERSVLAQHGFSSFRDYLQARHEVSTTDTHLALARREFEAARAAWEQLQAAMAPTMIIDLTGDEPRII